MFNESLISRLKQVAQLKTLFEKSTKEIEARFNEDFTSVPPLRLIAVLSLCLVLFKRLVAV